MKLIGFLVDLLKKCDSTYEVRMKVLNQVELLRKFATESSLNFLTVIDT